MASLKKFNGTTWDNAKVRKLGTSTDTLTTLPADLYADGNNATVGISGNTIQSGTPTQDNPIMPQECGDMTGNLVRFYQEEMQDNFYGVDITVKNAEITLNGTVSVGSGHWVEIGYKFGGGTESTDAVVIPCEPETTYTITIEILDGNSSEVRLIAFGTADGNKTVNIGSSLTTVFSGDINRIFISLGAEGVVFNNLKIRVMFNKGSTVLPYEPYGIKIPVISAGQTNNIYLGEVETTRRIKKLVLTGGESWTKNDVSNPSNYLYYQTGYLANKTCVCSHLEDMGTLSASKVGIFNANNVLYLNFGSAIMNAQPSGNTVAGLKEYLAAQYAAGTPVTVWYVLATEETGIVNEPLRKIGDYADTVSGITIPTITGKDTFDVETTLKPSEVSLSYTGWHDASVKEWDGSQWS